MWVSLGAIQCISRMPRSKAVPSRGADTADKNALWEGNIWYNAYTAKNLFRFMVDGINGFGQGDKQTLYFSPAGCSVKQSRLATIRYLPPAMATPSFTASTILSMFMWPGTISL
mgnify:CR=1 FL=1